MVGKKIVVGSVLLSLVACSDAAVFDAIADPVAGAREATPGPSGTDDTSDSVRVPIAPGRVGGPGARGPSGDTGAWPGDTGWFPGDTGSPRETGEDPYGEDSGDTGDCGSDSGFGP